MQLSVTADALRLDETVLEVNEFRKLIPAILSPPVVSASISEALRRSDKGVVCLAVMVRVGVKACCVGSQGSVPFLLSDLRDALTERADRLLFHSPSAFKRLTMCPVPLALFLTSAPPPRTIFPSIRSWILMKLKRLCSLCLCL